MHCRAMLLLSGAKACFVKFNISPYIVIIPTSYGISIASTIWVITSSVVMPLARAS